MKLKLIAYGLFVVAAMYHFEIFFERPKHVYINSPFDEQRAYFQEFFKWKDEFYGKFDVAFLKYGLLIRTPSICFVFK